MAEAGNNHYVYQHTFADGSVYIGKGLGNRAYRMTPSKRNSLWLNTAKKYGLPDVSFIKTSLSEDDALSLEVKTIDRLKKDGQRLRNLAPGGKAPQAGLTGRLSPSFGKKHTSRWVSMMSERNSGSGNPHFGRKHTLEAKKRISKNTKTTWETKYEVMANINRGRKLTDEHKEKIGAASLAMTPESREIIKIKNTGKKRTPEQIKNYKKAAGKRRGVPMSKEARQKMSDNHHRKDTRPHHFIGPDGQIFTGTRSEFSNNFGFSVNDLFRTDKKRRPHVKGWRLGDY